MAAAKTTEDIPGLVKAHFLSPFGCFLVTGSPRGIRSVSFVDTKPCPAGPIPRVLRNGVKQLDEYFRQQRTEFDLPLDFSGHTHFHQAVWQELLKIPYGRTTSYLAIADRLGDVKAIRAVGQANRNNPMAIIVPCHRVIAKNGDLQGYFYGLDFKRRLLELENPLSFARQGSLF
ncbi:MAG: cysteine methyltransferase [Bacteroidetes bacterium]|nr:MAG: cysteine methyltransferase [Bacteroidota bacterium]PTM12934.1 MAG: cysteine methyltransferase [Bacteroidota bacterium]